MSLTLTACAQPPGRRSWPLRVPDQDATSVAKLRDAGAIIVGKCNMHEFAYGATTDNPHYGRTHNPWDLSRIPGGSSGGSAAAVAAGLCITAAGSDSGGSIRIPAALCGVVGLKPSFGRISCQGLIPPSGELDHPGPITRSVYDAAVMLEVMAGWDAADPVTAHCPVPAYKAVLNGDVRELRVAVDPEYALRGISSEVESNFERCLEVLKELGIEVVEVRLPRVEEGMSAALTILMSEETAYHAEWLRTRPGDYGPDVRARLEKGLGITGMDYARAQRTRRLLMRDFELLFEDADLFITPTCGITAPAHGEQIVVVDGKEVFAIGALTRFTRLFNLTGLPAISVPSGFSHEGLPIGVQLVGRAFDEVTVFRAAYAYEQATTWHIQKPALASLCQVQKDTIPDEPNCH